VRHDVLLRRLHVVPCSLKKLTHSGIYKRTNKSVQLVDLSRLNALTKMEEENASFKCGASVSLTRLVNALSAASSQNCSVVSAHLKKVGNRPVRNVSRVSNLFLPAF